MDILMNSWHSIKKKGSKALPAIGKAASKGASLAGDLGSKMIKGK
jgi:hypothetical protein